MSQEFHSNPPDVPPNLIRRVRTMALGLVYFAAAISFAQPVPTPTPTVVPSCSTYFFVSRNEYSPSANMPQLYVQSDLCYAGNYSIKIYNTAGEKVRTLRDTTSQPAGPDQVTWDGKNDGGQNVASGVYIIIMLDTLSYHAAKVVVIR